uniref:Secreted protein n=1 Tax=Heterorhabditis bacteriophora TaxID=37862 RepID=A0A1I7X495_HETBA
MLLAFIAVLLLQEIMGGRDGYINKDYTMDIDRSQDCELLHITKNGYQFRRRFTTCDPKDYAFEELHYGHILEVDHPIPTSEKPTIQFNVLAEEANDVLLNLFSKTDHIAKSIEFRSSESDSQMSLPQTSGNCCRHSSTFVLAPSVLSKCPFCDLNVLRPREPLPSIKYHFISV